MMTFLPATSLGEASTVVERLNSMCANRQRRGKLAALPVSRYGESDQRRKRFLRRDAQTEKPNAAGQTRRSSSVQAVAPRHAGLVCGREKVFQESVTGSAGTRPGSTRDVPGWRITPLCPETYSESCAIFSMVASLLAVVELRVLSPDSRGIGPTFPTVRHRQRREPRTLGDCLALFRKEPEWSLDTPMDMEASTAQVVAGAFAARASILDGLVVLGLEAR
jgi:hypothetical protein